jgi:hypothetical protein
MSEEPKVRADAKLEDIRALMDLNRAEAEALQEGMKKRKADGEKLADTAASLHGDKHLNGVFDKDKK